MVAGIQQQCAMIRKKEFSYGEHSVAHCVATSAELASHQSAELTGVELLRLPQLQRNGRVARSAAPQGDGPSHLPAVLTPRRPCADTESSTTNDTSSLDGDHTTWNQQALHNTSGRIGVARRVCPDTWVGRVVPGSGFHSPACI